ncbi:hypothetical protein DFH06DRAFT_1138733 [Mycena polygramma]|nr:hypothetical protein DFH06DRAFT_1138733 [Mycena polygramma]
MYNFLELRFGDPKSWEILARVNLVERNHEKHVEYGITGPPGWACNGHRGPPGDVTLGGRDARQACNAQRDMEFAAHAQPQRARHPAPFHLLLTHLPAAPGLFYTIVFGQSRLLAAQRQQTLSGPATRGRKARGGGTPAGAGGRLARSTMYGGRPAYAHQSLGFAEFESARAPLPIPAGVAAPVAALVAANPAPVPVNPAPVITRALRVSAGVQVETPYPFLPPNGLSILNLSEARLTDRIARGQGLSKEEVMILLSPCPSCTQYFLHRTIEEHYKECTLSRRRES